MPNDNPDTHKRATAGKGDTAADELDRLLRDDEGSLLLAIDAGEVARLIEQIRRDHPHLWPERNTHE